MFRLIKSRNKSTKRTKVDKQIDEMQMSIVREINSSINDLQGITKMFRKTRVRDEDVVEIYNLANSAIFKLKNLASDLQTDARL